MRRLHSQTGFTLIEIMVVVFILALLVTLVAPKIMGQTVKAKRNTASLRHACQGFEKIIVDRITFEVDAFFLAHGSLEARALLGDISELAKGVGEFHAAQVQLETLRNFIAPRFCPRQRCKR